MLLSPKNGGNWKGWLVFLTGFVWILWCDEAGEERVKKVEEELWDLVVNHN